jgi:hypothetical protein
MQTMIRANQLMLQLLCDLPTKQRHKLSPWLTKCLKGGVVQKNGCWLLGGSKAVVTREAIERHHNRTGLEHAVNGIHIDGKDNSDFVWIQEQGFLFVRKLIDLLEPHGV